MVLILIFYILPTLFFLAFNMVQLHLVICYIKYHKNCNRDSPFPTILDKDLPFVTVQLPFYNEIYVAERIIDKVAQFDYPRDKFEIQILDDSDDETVEISLRKAKKYRQNGINIELIIRNDRFGFKAGALKEGLRKAKGEYIAIFDADFVPPADFLRCTIPYFFKDTKIGVVQTRWDHLNRNYSLLTKIQAFALDAHFSIEQQGRNAGGYFINFNGTAGLWKHECIVDAGGWQSDTLIEDLDLSYRAQAKGWKFKYLENFCTPAELPVSMSAVKSQQFRWTKGGAENARKNLSLIWNSKIKFSQKIHATAHLLSCFVYLLLFISSSLSIPMLLIKNLTNDTSYFYLLSLFLISLISLGIFYFYSTFSRIKNVYHALIRFIFMFPIFLSISMGFSLLNSIAVIEGFLGFKSPFIRTPKFNISEKNKTWKNNKYNDRKISLVTFFEAFLSLYFFIGIIVAIYFKDFGFLPLHLLLTIGFGMLFCCTIKHLCFT